MMKCALALVFPALAASLAAFAQDVVLQNRPIERISVSVTRGRSVRLMSVGKDGTPTLIDNAVGERTWKTSPNPRQTTMPLNATVLGLPNAEVRAYAADKRGIEEFSASRTSDPWTRTVIDERPSRGQPCAVRSDRYSWVFAPANDSGVIALRGRSGDAWKRLELESLLSNEDVTAVNCSPIASDQVAVVLTKRTGGVHAAVLNDAGKVLSIVELKGEVDTAFGGHAAITGLNSRLAVFGISKEGSLLHWQADNHLVKDGWTVRPVSSGSVARLEGSPSTTWHDGNLYVAARTIDQNVAVLFKSPDSDWSASTLAAGEPVLSDPYLTSQPEKLSLLALLRSGSATLWEQVDGRWIAGSLAEAGTTSLPSKASATSTKLAASQSLQQYIDSIPLNSLLPATPPTVTATTTNLRAEGGVRFQDITRTIQRSANLSEAVAYNPNSDVAYVCNLIQGKTVRDGLLAQIWAARAPCTITLLDIDGSGPVSQTISSPSLATITQGIRDLIRGLGPVKTTAYVDYDSQSGQTLEDALLKVGFSVEFLGQSAKANLQATTTRKTNTVVVKFRQRYYTVAAGSPSSSSAMFAPGVSVEDVKATVAPGNPPSYLSSMSFGRLAFYTFESSEESSKLQSAVDAVFDIAKVKGTVSLSTEQQAIFKNTRIRYYALGGSADDAFKPITTEEFSTGLRDYLQGGRNFSLESPAAPLAYTIRYMKDGTVLQSNFSTTWYTTETYALPEKGTFKIGLGPKMPGIGQGIVQTGFFVRPGDRFSIQAAGGIWSGVALTGSNPPTGWYTWAKPSQRGFPNMNVSPFSLLYRIGDMTPPPFAGYGFPSRDHSGTTGELGLVINSNNFNNGAGMFTVTVSVERRQN